jgi:hypothetical protein
LPLVAQAIFAANAPCIGGNRGSDALLPFFTYLAAILSDYG